MITAGLTQLGIFNTILRLVRSASIFFVVISGLQASWKTDFLVIFLLRANQFARKWYKSALFVRNKKMSDKSVLREAWSPEMTSQTFPVSCYWSRGFVPRRKRKFHVFGTSIQGEGKSLSKFFFAMLNISTMGRCNRVNKKNQSYTLKVAEHSF